MNVQECAACGSITCDYVSINNEYICCECETFFTGELKAFLESATRTQKNNFLSDCRQLHNIAVGGAE